MNITNCAWCGRPTETPFATDYDDLDAPAVLCDPPRDCLVQWTDELQNRREYNDEAGVSRYSDTISAVPPRLIPSNGCVVVETTSPYAEVRKRALTYRMAWIAARYYDNTSGAHQFEFARLDLHDVDETTARRASAMASDLIAGDVGPRCVNCHREINRTPEIPWCTGCMTKGAI